MANKELTAADLRHKLLQEGESVLLAVIEAAKDGNSIHPNYHPPSQDKVWNALIPILQNTAAKDKINAKTNAEVLALVSKGEISISEAKEMVSLLALINGTQLEDNGDNQKIIIEIARGKPIEKDKPKGEEQIHN